MRRILIVPSISTSSVVDSKSYQELYSLTEVAAKSGDKSFWYMVVPPWVKDGLRGHPALHYVHIETTRDADVNDVIGYSAHNLAEWFARRGGRYVIDAVVTDCVQFSLQLSRLLSDPAKKLIPMFVRDLKRRHTKKRMDPVSEMSMAMNLCAGRVGVLSEYSSKQVVSFLGKHIVPVDTRDFIKNTFIWRESSNIKYLEGCKERAERGDTLTAFLGGDPDYNGGKKILPIYRNLFALGTEVKVTSRRSASKVKYMLPDRDVSYISEIKSKVPKDAYYIDAARAHLFVSAGVSEVALHDEMERMILGQIGVFPYVDFVREALGNNYPFYYNPGKWTEAYEMAAWIVENYSEAEEMVKGVVGHVKLLLSEEINLGHVWSLMKHVIDSQYTVHKMQEPEDGKIPLFYEVMAVAKGLGEQFAMLVFLDVIEEKVSYLKPWNRKGSLMTLGNVKVPLPTMYDLREMLDNLGWVDQCKGHNAVFLWEREPLDGVLNAKEENEKA